MDIETIVAQKEQIFHLIDELKKDNYANVSDEHRKFIGPIMDYLINNISDSKSKELFFDIYGRMSSCSDEQKKNNRQIEQSFNLTEHLRKIANLGDCPDEILNNCFINSEVVDSMSSISLYSSTQEIADKNLCRIYELQARKIWNEIVGCKSEPNQTLAKIVDGKQVKFRFMDSDEFDGRFCAERINSNELVIDINKGCFSEENIDNLPMLIAHEAGHLMDVSERPKGYYAHNKKEEEHLADICGAQMVLNAGYSINGFADFLSNQSEVTKDALLQDRAKVLKDLLAYKSKPLDNTLKMLLEKTGRINNGSSRWCNNTSDVSKMRFDINLYKKSR